MSRGLVVGILVGLGLVLVACGDDSSPDPTPNIQATIEAGIQTAIAGQSTPSPLADGMSGTGAAGGEQIALLGSTHIPEGDPYDRLQLQPSHLRSPLGHRLGKLRHLR